jgi:hypothetical protein
LPSCSVRLALPEQATRRGLALAAGFDQVSASHAVTCAEDRGARGHDGRRCVRRSAPTTPATRPIE